MTVAMTATRSIKFMSVEEIRNGRDGNESVRQMKWFERKQFRIDEREKFASPFSIWCV